MIALNMPPEANMKSYLRKLFDCTQTKGAKVFGAWVLIPGILVKANEGALDLIRVTYNLVQSTTFWESFAYVATCAAVIMVTGCFKTEVAKMRKEHKPF
jgi:hypothetical protein